MTARLVSNYSESDSGLLVPFWVEGDIGGQSSYIALYNGFNAVDRVIEPPTQQLHLSNEEVIVNNDYVTRPGTASLSLSTTAPTREHTLFYREVPTSSLTLSPKTPRLAQSVRVENSFVYTMPVEAEYVFTLPLQAQREYIYNYQLNPEALNEYEFNYTALSNEQVIQEFTVNYALLVETEFLLTYNLPVPVVAEHVNVYDLIETIPQEFVLNYSPVTLPVTEFDFQYLLETTLVNSEFTLGSEFTTAAVSEISFLYDAPLGQGIAQEWSLVYDPAPGITLEFEAAYGFAFTTNVLVEFVVNQEPASKPAVEWSLAYDLTPPIAQQFEITYSFDVSPTTVITEFVVNQEPASYPAVEWTLDYSLIPPVIQQFELPYSFDVSPTTVITEFVVNQEPASYPAIEWGFSYDLTPPVIQQFELSYLFDAPPATAVTDFEFSAPYADVKLTEFVINQEPASYPAIEWTFPYETAVVVYTATEFTFIDTGFSPVLREFTSTYDLIETVPNEFSFYYSSTTNVLNEAAFSYYIYLYEPLAVEFGFNYSILVSNEYSLNAPFTTLPVKEFGFVYDQIPETVVANEWAAVYKINEPLIQEYELSYLYDVVPTTALTEFTFNYSPVATPVTYFDLTSPFTTGVATQFEFNYSPVATPATSFTFTYDVNQELIVGYEFGYEIIAVDKIAQQFTFGYGLGVETGFDFDYSLRRTVDAEFTVAYTSTQSLLNSYDLVYSLETLNLLTKEYNFIYSLVGSHIIVTDDQPYITYNGNRIPIYEAEISTSEDDLYWTASIQLASVNDYLLFHQDDDFSVNIFGEVYNFIVDSKSMQRSAPDVSQSIQAPVYRLEGISPSARFDEPRAYPLYSNVWDATVMAADAATEALRSLDPTATLTWNLIDWPLPAFRLAVENVSPIEVATQLAEAAGGVVQSSKAGEFYVRHRYPVSTVDYATTSPVHSFNEIDDIIGVSGSMLAERIVNKLRILDIEVSYQDTLEWIENENDPLRLSGELHAYPSPWRDPALINVRSTVCDMRITMVNRGIWTIDLPEPSDDAESDYEVVEIVEGQGNTSKPIWSIIEVVWYSCELGSLAYEQGSSTVRISGGSDPDQQYGLIGIKYRTQFIKYDVTSSQYLPAQFVLEDLTE